MDICSFRGKFDEHGHTSIYMDGVFMNGLPEKVLDNICEGVWVIDDKNKIIYFNEGMERITGIKKDQVIGNSLKYYMKTAQRKVGYDAHFWELFCRVKDTLKPIHYHSVPIFTLFGDISFQSGHMVPLIEKNKYAGMICTVEDVSRQQLSEKRSRQNLRAEEKLQEIYRNSPVVAFLWSAEENWPVEFVSDNIAQFGYTPGDFTSEKLTYGDMVHPDDLEKVRSDVNKIEVEGKIYFSKEYRIITKSGDYRWVVERSLLGRDELNRPAYYQGIIVDITDRMKAEEALKRSREALEKYSTELARANEELKSLDKMKDQFLSNVSHELKTPLTSIKGYSELLYDETLGNMNDQQKKAEKTILRNVDRLKRLVDSLLYISRSQMGNVDYLFEEISLEEIVDMVYQDLKIQLDEKDLQFSTRIPESLPLIKGDRDKLTDMLSNIVDNSIKFTPSGGCISVSVTEEDRYLHLVLSDTGIGIPEDLIPNLFQRFYQIDSSHTRKYGGTGLGLYICKEIVKAHEGEVWVESEGKNKGTHVHIKLPK